MDNGVIFYIVFGPAIFVLALLATAALHLLIGAATSRMITANQRRSERAYVKKHQRDISSL